MRRLAAGWFEMFCEKGTQGGLKTGSMLALAADFHLFSCSHFDLTDLLKSESEFFDLVTVEVTLMPDVVLCFSNRV